ncbi:MAG: transketolase [Synergistaceae bacterium]|nr:transketolase [Synergistaceae bacterium]
MSLRDLERKARYLRRWVVELIYAAKSGHLGGSLSIMDMLAALYYGVIRVDPARPDWPGRDRFVLSKGHTAPALYAVLADKGFFSKEDLFDGYRRINSIFQGHPDFKKTPGLDMSAGSLGVGLSAACGMALGAARSGAGFLVYSIVGDGETNEGEIWEAAMFAAHHRLDNLTVMIDMNGMQNDGPTRDVMDMGDMSEKWRSFGWSVRDVDGHSLADIQAALRDASASRGRPGVLICRTIKGKGVSFMENNIHFHGAVPTRQEYEAAMRELS